MTGSPWSALEDEVARSVAVNGTLRFWLRDDDATDVTPALERLTALCEGVGMPILLATVPARATATLADFAGAHPLVHPCQHGWSHANHAEPGARACELGGTRDDAVVIEELVRGRGRMAELFGTHVRPILVPPWNRIRPSLIPQLPSLGFTALSAFRSREPEALAPLATISCDLDIINWRAGACGRSIEDLCGRLSDLVVAARDSDAPIGILTHHLAHDEAAWAFVEAFFGRAGDWPGVRFVGVPLPSSRA